MQPPDVMDALFAASIALLVAFLALLVAIGAHDRIDETKPLESGPKPATEATPARSNKKE